MERRFRANASLEDLFPISGISVDQR